MNNKWNDAWQLVTGKLFCPETSLIYDSLSSDDPEKRFAHLPFPEEIQKNIPNPCSWGTGMEDSMLNGGTILDALVFRMEQEEENRASLLDFALKILKGIELCNTVHGVHGYLVRSVSPRDGKSFYIDTSRDQFTCCTRGLLHFYRSSFADEDTKRRIRQILTSFADLCAERIRPGENGNLGRLDGRPGLVGEMISCRPHEAFRLPMMYLAAYIASGEAKYHRLYDKCVDDALAASMKIVSDGNVVNWGLVQMQESLSICAECGFMQQRKEQAVSIMQTVAARAEKEFYPAAERFFAYNGRWDIPAIPWQNAAVMFLVPGTVFQDRASLFGDYLYLKPEEASDYQLPLDIMTAVGNLAACVAFAPGYQPSEKFRSTFERAFDIPDYACFKSAKVCYMLYALCLLRAHTGNPA